MIMNKENIRITFSGTFEMKKFSEILMKYGVPESQVDECLIEIISMSEGGTKVKSEQEL